MSMLTQGLQAPLDWAERPAPISKARKATFKRAAARALALLTIGGVLTTLIALKQSSTSGTSMVEAPS